MATDRQLQMVEDIARDVDMLVFRLETERAADPDPDEVAQQQQALRRDLEKIRDRLLDVGPGV